MKRVLLCGLLLLAILSLAIFGRTWGNQARQPNVIFILVDTLRADYLGCYGFDGDVSPQIDSFAQRSIRFGRCCSQSPWTPPSIGSCFTSRYPMPVPTDTGAFQISILPESHVTLAESFQNAGYETRAFVENGLLIPQNGFSQGFDTYAQKSSQQEKFKAFSKFLEWLIERGQGSEAGGQDPSADEKPFFAYIHVMDVHGPYRYLQPNFDAVKNSESLGPPTPVTAQQLEDRPKPIATFIPWTDEAEAKERRSWRGAYAAGIRLFDRKFGRFMEKLEQAGVLEDSIVVITSDHGEQLLDDGGWGHGHNLQSYQTNVPLIIRLPKDEHGGAVVGDLVRLVDVTPTLASFCSLESVKAWEGRSLKPLMQGSSMPSLPGYSTSIIGDPNIFSVRDRDHLLIWDGQTNTHSLYDAGQPTWLQKDLSDSLPDVTDQLSGLVKEHIRQLNSKEPAMGSAPMPENMIEAVRDLGYIQ